MNFLKLKCEVRNQSIIGMNDVLNDKGRGCALFCLPKPLLLTNRPKWFGSIRCFCIVY